MFQGGFDSGTRHVCFSGRRGMKSTSVSTATVKASQGGVEKRSLLVVDIGCMGEAQGAVPRYCAFFNSLIFDLINCLHIRLIPYTQEV